MLVALSADYCIWTSRCYSRRLACWLSLLHLLSLLTSVALHRVPMPLPSLPCQLVLVN
ncbi:hypothetical protein BDV06DRAFT_190909 [Aspergillus oleicola]